MPSISQERDRKTVLGLILVNGNPMKVVTSRFVEESWLLHRGCGFNFKYSYWRQKAVPVSARNNTTAEENPREASYQDFFLSPFLASI